MRSELKVVCYADDTIILHYGSQLAKVQSSVAESMALALRLLKGIGLDINRKKTEVIIFHRSATPHLSLIHI